MSYALGDHGLVSAEIDWPAQGTWTAEVEVNTEESMGGAQTLHLPGVDLVGYVVGGGVSVARQKLRLIGGKGGLRRVVKGQHFNTTDMRTVANYLLSQAGETLATDSDTAILSTKIDHWSHHTESAGRGLDRICAQLKTQWTVKPDGTVRIGDPSWSTYEPDHDVIDEDLRGGSMIVATHDDTIRPGTSFLGKRVSAIEIAVRTVPEDQVRTTVHWGANGHPFDDELRKAVRHHQEKTLPLYEGRVVTFNAAKAELDIEPVSQEVRDIVGPGWQRVPLFLVGAATVKPTAGAICVVEFLDNDRGKPFVRSFRSGTFSEISETATSKIESKAPTMDLGTANAAMTLAGSSKPVVRVGDTVAGLTSAMAGQPVTGTYGAVPPVSTVKA